MEGKKTLNAAMAKFQESYSPPIRNNKVDFKTAKGQRIKYDYADLRALQDAIRKTGAPLGIGFRTSFVQFEQLNNLWLKAVVTITHEEREVDVDGIPLFVASGSGRMPDAQASGSLRTYAERYALQSAFGIASDGDDDGAIAKDNLRKDSQNQQLPPEKQPANQSEDLINNTLGNMYPFFQQRSMPKATFKSGLEYRLGVQSVYQAQQSDVLNAGKLWQEEILKDEQPQQRPNQQPNNNFTWGQQ